MPGTQGSGDRAQRPQPCQTREGRFSPMFHHVQSRTSGLTAGRARRQRFPKEAKTSSRPHGWVIVSSRRRSRKDKNPFIHVTSSLTCSSTGYYATWTVLCCPTQLITPTTVPARKKEGVSLLGCEKLRNVCTCRRYRV